MPMVLDDATRTATLARWECELADAQQKAVISLARYKFIQFGYWAAIWVHLNKISGLKRANPFWRFVRLARDEAMEKFGVGIPEPKWAKKTRVVGE